MTCITCGQPTKQKCACGRHICPRHAYYYFDDTNEAITRSAVGKCVVCSPPKWPRPYTRLQAIMNNEWWADL